MTLSSENRPVRLMFRAFRYRNYRLFFGGQGISLIGTWMQRIAIGWLVYRLTQSPAMLGIAGFFSQFPTFVLAPFAGVMVDKWDRYRIVIIAQILAMLQAMVLVVLFYSHTITVWWIIALTALLALVNAFDIPARQSFVIEMVDDKNDLGNAIALNSAMFNSARLIGPSLAGVLIAVVGEGPCFSFNALSFLAVIVALIAMKVKPRSIAKMKQSVFQELKMGFSYAFGSVPIRSTLILLAIVSLVGMPYTILMPVMAQDILHGGAKTLGLLMAAVGVGALAGAGFLASRKDARGLEKMIPISASVFGAGMIVFSLSRSIYLSLPMLAVTGFGMMASMATSNTVLQTVVDDDKRGRVMSFFAMAFMGMAPLGSLLGGWSANLIGAPNTLLVSGIISIAAAFLFARELMLIRPILASIKRRLGIPPVVPRYPTPLE